MNRFDRYRNLSASTKDALDRLADAIDALEAEVDGLAAETNTEHASN